MKLHTPTLGPILGEVTSDRARIWLRGDTQVIDDMPRRAFGILRYRKSSHSTWTTCKPFKANPNFDLTGICILSGLSRNTVYVYQAAFFYSDSELEDAQFDPDNANWDKAITSQFRTADNRKNAPRTFAIGSCRYLLRTFLGNFWDDRGDKTFKSILKQIDGGIDYHQLIMMGDQIYADDLNIMGPDKTLAQFYKRYRAAFGQKYIRKLMSQVPTYMTLDDHEIEDNWPEKATSKDWKTLYPIAMHAYQTYQVSHSPNLKVFTDPRTKALHLLGTPEKLWYTHSDGCCDVFMTDTRTQRIVSSDSNRRRIIDKNQMNALKRWLNDGSGRVKVIVTSVPFFPDIKSKSPEESDKWNGFSKQRIELLEHIEKHKVKKVLFLSGDVHASMSVEMVSPGGTKIISVVSSAFFWPYPGIRKSSFLLKGTIDGGNAGQFVLQNPTKVFKDDNFTRLQITPSKVKVDVFERKGKHAKSSSSEFRF